MRHISCSAQMVSFLPSFSSASRAPRRGTILCICLPHALRQFDEDTDKTIKLWKVFEKSLQLVSENNLSEGLAPPSAYTSRPLSDSLRVAPGSGSHLRLPKINVHDTIVAAVPRKIYANAHAYHVNSISVNSDAETYISADDLRINLWNLGISDRSFNIVDIKPTNMEELTEVITAAEFHPINCNNFVYSSSKGTIKMADMRDAALCDQHAKLFEEEEGDSTSKSFFSEIISSISDVKFSHDGRYLLSRDYLTLKIWDVNMDRAPVATISIHEHIRSKLCDLYENDCIFDKFEALWGPDDQHVLTGSYSNYLHVFDKNQPDPAASGVALQADKSAFRHKKLGGKGGRGKMPGPGPVTQVNVDNVDFTKKILHASYHPREHTIAIAATNNLFIFTAAGPQPIGGPPAFQQGFPTQPAI